MSNELSMLNDALKKELQKDLREDRIEQLTYQVSMLIKLLEKEKAEKESLMIALEGFDGGTIFSTAKD